MGIYGKWIKSAIFEYNKAKSVKNKEKTEYKIISGSVCINKGLYYG